jgi:hypothetical protein
VKDRRVGNSPLKRRFVAGTSADGHNDLMLCGLVLCGLVLCGLVLCGLVLCGLVLCGLVLCGLVLCGLVLCGLVLCGLVLCGHDLLLESCAGGSLDPEVSFIET